MGESMSNRLNVFSPNLNDPNFGIPNNVPTLKVDPTMGSLISVSGGIRCVNVIAGGTIKVQSGSLASNQQIMFLNTSGSKPIFISLDNGGLVAGATTYALGSGSNVSVIFDGTNLNQQQ
jgi:hypothetical protein